MPDIALYYPYTHVRDESWLKAAALYLPKLALLAPRDYPFEFRQPRRCSAMSWTFWWRSILPCRAHAVSTEFLGCRTGRRRSCHALRLARVPGRALSDRRPGRRQGCH